MYENFHKEFPPSINCTYIVQLGVPLNFPQTVPNIDKLHILSSTWSSPTECSSAVGCTILDWDSASRKHEHNYYEFSDQIIILLLMLYTCYIDSRPHRVGQSNLLALEWSTFYEWWLLFFTLLLWYWLLHCLVPTDNGPHSMYTSWIVLSWGSIEINVLEGDYSYKLNT